MAPVALEADIRYAPIAVAASHPVAVVALTSLVVRGLYRSHKALTPSQSTRPRLESRASLTPVFAGLAGLSLVLAAWSATSYATLSYSVWADQRGIEAAPSLQARGTQVARWLSDTAVYRDALEIVAEKARRFWWSQQVDLGTAAWSTLLVIEGRRRRISYLAAYLGLAHLVGLSFAQNLFYVALLLTPAPLQETGPETCPLARAINSVFTPKPVNWCPFPILFAGILGVDFAAISALPYFAGGPYFTWATAASRGLTFVLLSMPTVVPVSWGTVHPHPHDAYGAYNKIFRAVSIASLLLHGKATFLGLLYNAPDAHYHRHSIHIPFDTAKRSAWERTSTALGKLLGSTADHPVVAAVGTDVMLSALSLGLWVAHRALDPRHVLQISSWPAVNLLADDESEGGKVEDQDSSLHFKTGSAEPRSSVRGRGKPRKLESSDAHPEDDSPASPTSPTSPSRRRGRPRKQQLIKDDPAEVPGDVTYEPSPQEEAVAAEGDVLRPGGPDWEAAALVWGTTALGGLGCGSAGGFGAECVSR